MDLHRIAIDTYEGKVMRYQALKLCGSFPCICKIIKKRRTKKMLDKARRKLENCQASFSMLAESIADIESALENDIRPSADITETDNENKLLECLQQQKIL